MNATTLILAYRNWLKSNSAMSAALQHTLRNGKLSDAVVHELAQAHTAHYAALAACFVLQNDKGAYRFYTCEEATSANRHGTAQQQWDRTIAKYQQRTAQENRGGSRNKTEVQVKLANQYAKLTTQQKRAFLKLIGL